MGPLVMYLISTKWLWYPHVEKPFKKTMGMGMCKIIKQMGKINPMNRVKIITWKMANCHNPTFGRVWRWHSHSQNGDLGVLRDSWNFKVGLHGLKHLALGCYLYHWKSYESVDVENELAWAIWTYVAQVMCKRRVGSQTGSLTRNH
jgi:hypothetical protein